MAKLVEGLWDCNYCGTKEIRGSIKVCRNCGKSRNTDTKFYLPSKVSLLPTEEAEKINRNPDWVCRYCENLNSDNDTSCVTCASPRTKDTVNYFKIIGTKRKKKGNRKIIAVLLTSQKVKAIPLMPILIGCRVGVQVPCPRFL